MGARSLIPALLVVASGACGPGSTSGGGEPTGPGKVTGDTIESRVVRDFEKAVLSNKDTYLALFDFVAVGEYEILLHRYDLNGRLSNLTEEEAAELFEEDGTPYPEARERRNVGNFYTFLAQRTVGTGGCTAKVPRTNYAKQLATFEPLPEDTPPKYQLLLDHVKAWTENGNGGVVGFTCTGGKGGLALVWTKKPNARGYDLITIYDD